MATQLTISAKFYNKEKLKNKEPNNLFDPDNITINIVDSNTNIIEAPIPLRLSQGQYIARIDSSILTDGNSYEVRWIYDLYPDTYQIQRYSFTYNASHPTITGMCRVHGTIFTFGLPIANAIIETTVIKDGFSKHFATSSNSTVSDVFGRFDVYLPIGERVDLFIQEINEKKYFQVPNTPSISLDSISPLVVTYTATDTFGNPV
jgi:hypothetical protein